VSKKQNPAKHHRYATPSTDISLYPHMTYEKINITSKPSGIKDQSQNGGFGMFSYDYAAQRLGMCRKVKKRFEK
jgi:hypothetical protein